MKTFTLNAKEATVNYSYERGKISLSFDAEMNDVAELLTVKEAVASFNVEELLDAIGSEKAKEHFGLVEEDA